MNSQTNIEPPKWFLAVAALALVWNLVGVAAYFGQVTMDTSSLPDAQRGFYDSIPAWATAAFAAAVFAGTLGSLALLLRKRWAIPVLVVSCIGIVVQLAHSFLLSNGLDVFGTSALILPSVTLAIGLALVWFAIFSRNRAWI